jgi:hypothetical protein
MMTLGKQAQIATIIAHAEQVGASFRLPIYRAALAGQIDIVECARGGTIPAQSLKAHRRPLLAVLGDDDATPTGPDGWPQARRLLRWWCRGVMLHGAGGEAAHYQAAVDLVRESGRLLLVETDSKHLISWQQLVAAQQPAIPTTIIHLRPGAPAHPSHELPPGAKIQ